MKLQIEKCDNGFLIVDEGNGLTHQKFVYETSDECPHSGVLRVLQFVRDTVTFDCEEADQDHFVKINCKCHEKLQMERE